MSYYCNKCNKEINSSSHICYPIIQNDKKKLPDDIEELVKIMELNARLEIGISLFAPMLKRLAKYIRTGE